MNKLKLFGQKLLYVLIVIALGATLLSFVMPTMSAKTLLIISTGLLILLYVAYKASSLLFKLALIITIVALAVKYLV